MICFVIHDEKVGGPNANPAHVLITGLVLRALDDEVEVEANALARDSHIFSRITFAIGGLSHFAGPTGVTPVRILRIPDDWNAIIVIVHL
jgi:hypothetical protein